MRHDGDITYYSIERIIQTLENNEKIHIDCGDMERYYDILPKETINAFTASGECWQKYGYHGIFDYDTAINVMDKLRNEILNDDTKNIEMTDRAFPDRQKPWAKILDFRVVKHRKVQETTYYERVSDIKKIESENVRKQNMQKIIIEIDTENAAFEDNDLNFELARILKKLAAQIEYEEKPEHLRDSNGNITGHVQYL